MNINDEYLKERERLLNSGYIPSNTYLLIDSITGEVDSVHIGWGSVVNSGKLDHIHSRYHAKQMFSMAKLDDVTLPKGVVMEKTQDYLDRNIN